MTSLSHPKASLLRRSLFRTREVLGSKKQPFAQGVIVNLRSKSWRSMHDSLVHMSTCSSPFSWHSNLLAFDEEPLGIQHSNLYVRERNTLFKFTCYMWNHFSLEQCLGELLSKFCVMSMLPLLNLEIALSAYFGNRRLSTKLRTKRGWEDHFLEVIKGKEFNGTCNISV